MCLWAQAKFMGQISSQSTCIDRGVGDPPEGNQGCSPGAFGGQRGERTHAHHKRD